LTPTEKGTFFNTSSKVRLEGNATIFLKNGFGLRFKIASGTTLSSIVHLLPVALVFAQRNCDIKKFAVVCDIPWNNPRITLLSLKSDRVRMSCALCLHGNGLKNLYKSSKIHDHDKKMEERREKHFHSLEKILEQQSEQRERMLKILEKGMRKRKHFDSE
jgi:hypothetical protein